MLAEVLDARLNALWDPAGAEDRLAAASEIMDLAQAAGDGIRERNGMFWGFVAMMELARGRGKVSPGGIPARGGRGR